MLLKLEVVGAQAGRLGERRSKLFAAEGGTIGRVDDNDWVLPDQYVSSHHAAIQCVDGQFFVIDTNSSNGVCLNAPGYRLERGRPYAIKTGDRLLIDPFDIHVSVVESMLAPRPAPQSDPFAVVDERPFAGTLPALPAGDSLAGRSVASLRSPRSESLLPNSALDEESSVDPIVALGLPEARGKAPSARRAEHLASGSPLQSHFEPPRMTPVAKPERESAPWVPQDYNPLVQTEVETDTAPAAAPSPPSPEVGLEAAPRRSSDTVETLDFAALLAAAGLEGVPITAELSANFGRILKVVLDGMRDMLRAREELKEQFRMRITTYQPLENNPIKFSANTPDALHNLLVKRNAAYLGPVAAFEEAFEDLRIHQMAIVAGLRAAYEAMLGNFDPQALETRFERYVKRGNLLAGGAKQRYWEFYADTFADLVRDPESGFQTLFGEAFSKAYEEQARLLKPGPLGK
jgi:type VI secretion system FHA domain protein